MVVTTNYREHVGKGLDLLNAGIRPFILQAMSTAYGGAAMEQALAGLQREGRPTPSRDAAAWDTQALLSVLWDHWNAAFRNRLGPAERSLVSELRDARNRWAHQQAFSADDAYRALDSTARLLRAVGAEGQAGEVERLKQAVLPVRAPRAADPASGQEAVLAGAEPGTLSPWAELTALGTTLRVVGPDRVEWDDPEFGRYPLVPDRLPPVEQVIAWSEAIRQALDQVPSSLDFRRIAYPETACWQGDTASGLRVPIGLNSTGEKHDLELGQGVVHHGLIGGMIGSGKSNLLHVIITQLALRYSPQELELYLVDFKEGVEFQDYLTLPHARVVALETEREFGLSVLRRLQDEMEARGRRYREQGSGITNLVEYRRQTGASLPRIVLVMDEFQVLFGEDDHLAREAGRILEDIVRRARAFGIHVLLSSQTPSGAGSYGNRTYNQMGLRIALRCRPQEAQLILGEGNEEVNRLERPGDAIYNDEMGHKEKNVFMRVALLPVQERHSYLAALQARASGRGAASPLTFQGRSPARLAENAALQALLRQPGWPAQGGTAQVWLGQAVEIKPATSAALERYARSNLLIAGGEEAAAYGLLLAALISLAAQRSPDDARFYVAEFARPDSPLADRFARVAGRLPHAVTVVGPRQVGALLTELQATLTARLDGAAPAQPSIYFLIAGLQRWRELRPADAYGQSEAGKQLLRLAEDGPDVGIQLIAWADGFATLERAFKRGGVANFDLRALLRLPEKDSNELLGSNAAARLEDNRAYFRHEDWEMGRLEKFKPYAVPDDETLAELLNLLAAKGSERGGRVGTDG